MKVSSKSFEKEPGTDVSIAIRQNASVPVDLLSIILSPSCYAVETNGSRI